VASRDIIWSGRAAFRGAHPPKTHAAIDERTDIFIDLWNFPHPNDVYRIHFYVRADVCFVLCLDGLQRGTTVDWFCNR
jgi:hypothetical protein